MSFRPSISLFLPPFPSSNKDIWSQKSFSAHPLQALPCSSFLRGAWLTRPKALLTCRIQCLFPNTHDHNLRPLPPSHAEENHHRNHTTCNIDELQITILCCSPLPKQTLMYEAASAPAPAHRPAGRRGWLPGRAGERYDPPRPVFASSIVRRQARRMATMQTAWRGGARIGSPEVDGGVHAPRKPTPVRMYIYFADRRAAHCHCTGETMVNVA